MDKKTVVKRQSSAASRFPYGISEPMTFAAFLPRGHLGYGHNRRVPDPEDSWSYGDWIGDLRPGAVVKHPAVPLVWNGGQPLESCS